MPGARSLLLVDDHELIRHGLTRAFEQASDFAVVGVAGTLEEARALFQSLRPQAVVTDVRLPDGSGLDLVKEIRELDPHVGVVVLTMYAGDDQLFAAMGAGASAFVPKHAPARDVVSAARHALVSPGTFTAPQLAEAMHRRLNTPLPRLSARESQVLNMLAEGVGVAGIAKALFISESTAKSHIAKIYEKLGAANRAQAIAEAARAGLLAGF